MCLRHVKRFLQAARRSAPRWPSTTTLTRTSLVLIMLMLMPPTRQGAEHPSGPCRCAVRIPDAQDQQLGDVRVGRHRHAGVDPGRDLARQRSARSRSGCGTLNDS